ncbi:hypothetical protein [Allosphingosinicella deserti]|uniref:AcrB/AcrD/AcrF family protein n=1 Tax=Allosphingosinicella deserti TaxID=2116704 RepID=A0A2P7QRV0_9SPHN|nr:hypothetical protein [Sphingomonas deserti]PSJ40685.1 hypothetical protein C7I55_10245 [Sphingomonas deserti]
MNAPATPPAEAGFRRRHLLLAWLGVCMIAAWLRRGQIAGFTLLDPDDHLRLVQVRDWLAGQGWFDLTQYRIQPAAGLTMHWSRLVDLPIAAGIRVLQPLLGTDAAERTTVILWPLVLLGLTMLIVAKFTSRLAEGNTPLVAALLIAGAPVTLVQFLPLRIDHHGWQILLAGLALLGLLSAEPRRSGIVAGAAMAAWLHVSIEGLPLAVLAGGLLGLRYIIDAAEARRLIAYLGTLVALTLTLLAATRLPQYWLTSYCDAMSPAYFVPMALVAALLWAGSRTPWMASAGARLGLVGASAILGAAGLLLIDPVCAANPFSTLDPLVARWWYLLIPEGLPIWRQPLESAVLLLWLPLIAIPGTWIGYRTAADDRARRDWTTLAFMFASALAIAFLVFRAGAVAQLFALPGAATLALAAIRRAQALKWVLLRVPFSAAVGMLPLPVLPALALNRVSPTAAIPSGGPVGDECDGPIAIAALRALPPSRLLAPLNVGPALLNYTRHSTLAAGYHRSNLAMRDAMLAFMSPPERSAQILRAHAVHYVLICATGAETGNYATDRPGGLMARLRDDKAPEWLERVPVAGASNMRIWKVNWTKAPGGEKAHGGAGTR